MILSRIPNESEEKEAIDLESCMSPVGLELAIYQPKTGNCFAECPYHIYIIVEASEMVKQKKWASLFQNDYDGAPLE